MHCKMAAGICNICAYQNSWYTVSVVQSSLPVYMQHNRVRNMSAGTVGRFKEGAEAGSKESWVEKYPELDTRVDLLQGMGMPLTVTTMSRVRELMGDQERQEEAGSILITSARSRYVVSFLVLMDMMRNFDWRMSMPISSFIQQIRDGSNHQTKI